ncbi:hypothetical protein [Desulfogranum japonicum]|uniref:hypothetical protein n=1 Tax=Desulfogranum japonicum TaxID=231447 RepID=UPI00041BD2A5|nr:hypothetical protein [Desulfogranum japonicum]
MGFSLLQYRDDASAHFFKKIPAFPFFIAILFVVSMILGTLHNTQPYTFHPDEPGKVRQIFSHQWNFHHPQLLLSTTRVAMKIADTFSHNGHKHKWNSQEVVELGRTVNAIFFALTACSVAIGFWLLRGTIWGMSAGIMVGICPPLVLRAHFMKEDPAMILGFGVMWLGFALLNRKSTVWAGVVIGLGMGLAIAGKYIGLAVGVMGSVAILAYPGWKNTTDRLNAAFLGMAMAVTIWAGADFEAILHWHDFLNGFTKEFAHSQHYHVGFYVPWYEFYFLRVIFIEAGHWACGLAMLGYCWAFYQRKKLLYAEWLMLIWPIAFYILLMFSKIGVQRYVLPVTIGLYAIAGWTIAEISMWFIRQKLRTWTGVCVGMILGSIVLFEAAGQLQQMYYAMAHDSRHRLETFMESLDKGAFVLAEIYTRYEPHKGERVGHKVRLAMQATAKGSVEELQEQGYTHVIICSFMYARYFLPGMEDAKEMAETDQLLRERYRVLLEEYEPIWDSGQAFWVVTPVNPEIKVYDLRAMKKKVL